MIQTCNKDYWKHMENVLARNGDPKNPGEPCGQTFDDAQRSTLCPHNLLPPPGPLIPAPRDGSSQCPY